MIAIFEDFDQFSAEKLAILKKINFIITFGHEKALFLFKMAISLTKIRNFSNRNVDHRSVRFVRSRFKVEVET
jgi:hypothetical protein